MKIYPSASHRDELRDLALERREKLIRKYRRVYQQGHVCPIEIKTEWEPCCYCCGNLVAMCVCARAVSTKDWVTRVRPRVVT